MNAVLPATFLIAFLGGISATGEGCCTPDQWQGVKISEFGYSGPNSSVGSSGVQIFYDATNSRVAANASVYRNGMTKLYFILNVKEEQRKDTTLNVVLNGGGPSRQKLYFVDLQTKRCYVSAAEFNKACTPGIGRFGGVFPVGAGNDRLMAKSYWWVTVPQPGDSMTSWIAVTNSDCVPVVATTYGTHNGIGFMETDGFIDFKLSIDKPSVFDVPAECKRAITTGLPEDIKHFRSVFFLSMLLP